jgi:hypothetical protein
MRDTRLRLDPNEASDLAPVFDAATLERNGWDRALATVLDGSPAEKAIALIVHRAGAAPDAGWEARRVECKPPRGLAGRTTDAEACACRDGWLYVLGSQHGAEDGPLEPRRSWIARARVDELAAHAAGGRRPRLQLARLRFALHRAVNDALAERAALELMPLAAAARRACIDATIDTGIRGGKRWAGRVRAGDQPISVDGVAFRADGRLLLGLRQPVTRDGRALLVELDDVGALFGEDDPVPGCGDVWTLAGRGEPERPVGVFALHSDAPDRFHAVLAGLDGAARASLALDGRPGGDAGAAHVRFELPARGADGAVAAEVVRAFDGAGRIEGIALLDAEVHYVIDEDGAVGLRTLMLDD